MLAYIILCALLVNMIECNVIKPYQPVKSLDFFETETGVPKNIDYKQYGLVRIARANAKTKKGEPVQVENRFGITGGVGNCPENYVLVQGKCIKVSELTDY